MKLSTRLLLLILGCMLPILAAQLFTEVQRNAERYQQFVAITRHTADQAIADLTSLIDGARRIGSVAGHSPALHVAGPACERALASLRDDMDSPKFLAVTNAEGGLLCAASPAIAAAWPQSQAWLPQRPVDALPTTGSVTTIPGFEGRFLPVSMRITRNASVSDILVVAFDLGAFTRQIAKEAPAPDTHVGNTFLFVTDRDGTVFGQVPIVDKPLQMLPETLRRLRTVPTPGIERVPDQSGGTWLAAHVPGPPGAAGLTAIAIVSPPDPMAYLGNGSVWDLLITGSCAMIALMLAWLAGRRFIYVPTEMLLRTAQRWREGDLNVRAALTEGGSEFGMLAQSFNAMASSLHARDLERR